MYNKYIFYVKVFGVFLGVFRLERNPLRQLQCCPIDSIHKSHNCIVIFFYQIQHKPYKKTYSIDVKLYSNTLYMFFGDQFYLPFVAVLQICEKQKCSNVTRISSCDNLKILQNTKINLEIKNKIAIAMLKTNGFCRILNMNVYTNCHRRRF